MPKKIENVRELIIDKAYNLFTLEGYEQVKTDRIARECNIAAGTLFNYFPTKWDLLIEILYEMKNSGIKNFIGLIDETTSDEDKIYNMVKNLYFVMDKIGKLGREFFSYLLSQDDEVFKRRSKQEDQTEEDLLSVLRNNIKVLADKDRELIRLLLLSLKAVIIGTYTKDPALRTERISFCSKTLLAMLKDIKNIENYQGRNNA